MGLTEVCGVVERSVRDKKGQGQTVYRCSRESPTCNNLSFFGGGGKQPFDERQKDKNGIK